MNPQPQLKIVPRPIEVDLDLYGNFWKGRDPSNGTVKLAVEDMARSGLMPATLERADVRLWRGNREDLRRSLGRSRLEGLEILQSCELVEFKNCDETGTHQYSRFRLYPEVNGTKYLQPLGIPAMPWIPQEVWALKEKNNVPIWITEGEKKALKLLQHGEPCISLPGVWNFKAGGRSREDWRDKEMWGCLRDFRVDGRTIFLAFDSDLWTNPGVRFALYELAVKLYARGALVRIVVWSGAKGIDDYLVAAPFVDNAIGTLKEYSRDLFGFVQPDHSNELIRALSVIELSPVRAEQLEIAISKTLGISRHSLRKEIKFRKEKDHAPPDFVEKLNERYALIHGLSEIWDTDQAKSMKVEAFRHLLPNDGKRWLETMKKRVVKMEDIVFEPGGAAEHQINLFKGWPLVADASKPHQKLVQHLLHMSDYDEAACHWMTCWLAWPLQHPGAKMATALVIHGAQGTGKNLLFETILKIYGDYGSVVDQKTIESDFTGWLSRRLMMVADEVVSNLQQVQVKNRIKGLVTGATSWINRKGIEPRVEANHCNLVFLSNEDVPLLIDSDDRRFFVLRCDRVEPAEYYKEIGAEIAAGGAAGLYHYLLNYDCSDFGGAHAKPPATEAKQVLSHLCERTPEKFLHAWQNEEIPVNCMTIYSRQVYALYCLWCNETNEHPVTETRFGRFMTKHYPRAKTRTGNVYQILKPSDDLTQDDVSFFQEKLEAYRKSIVAVKAR